MALTGGLSIGHSPPVAGAVPPAERFLREASANNLFASQSSELALTSSHDPDVQAFARGMVDRRPLLTRQLRAAVGPSNWGMIVNEGSSGAFQARIPQLMFAAQKGDFDRAFLQSQVEASAALKADLEEFIRSPPPRKGCARR